MVKAVDYLHVAKGLIAHPSRWIKGRSAADEFKYPIYNSDDAACWCATGAVDRAVQFLSGGPYSLSGSEHGKLLKALDDAAKSRGYSGIIHFNDAIETSHQDVINLFDEVERNLNA